MPFDGLLLLPAEHFEESLGLRLVTDHSGEGLDRLRVTRLLQTFQERYVRFPEFEPVGHGLVVTARERLSLVRIAETQHTIKSHHTRQRQYLADTLIELRVHYAIRPAFVQLDHRLADLPVVIVVEQDTFL